MSDTTFGPEINADGVRFRIWAPRQTQMLLCLEDQPPRPMTTAPNGWHELLAEDARIGSRYRFQLEDGLRVPDPASRYQPDDVHGPSEVMDADEYRWSATDWNGRPWRESVIYELHVGTFTPVGTFRAAIEKLDHLQALGITAIQIMPVADFRGARGWGYDGVLPYAPDASYGRPDDLKALVDAAHKRSISVFLDVVYNHLGPDGNYLPIYAPITTDHHSTPWGAAMNFDGEGSVAVREFYVENAIYWLEQFRFDGLRFDAVHSIKDDSDEKILDEIARRIRETIQGREVHLILENEENDASLLERAADGSPESYTAQWNDDVHHVLHVAASGEVTGYYADYADDAGMIGRALTAGFVYQGEVMPFRGSERGMPSGHLPPTAFVSFIQNHDQIGNRAFGDRLSETLDPARMQALAEIYLLAPQIPMMFMGEEWGAKSPFPFFCDFDDDLNQKVRDGRKSELFRMPGFSGDASDAPDPTALETFLSAKLDWASSEEGQGAGRLAFYRSLITLRQTHVVPMLDGLGARPAEYESRGGLVRVTWFGDNGDALIFAGNFGEHDEPIELPERANILYPSHGAPISKLAPWDVVWLKSG